MRSPSSQVSFGSLTPSPQRGVWDSSGSFGSHDAGLAAFPSVWQPGSWQSVRISESSSTVLEHCGVVGPEHCKLQNPGNPFSTPSSQTSVPPSVFQMMPSPQVAVWHVPNGPSGQESEMSRSPSSHCSLFGSSVAPFPHDGVWDSSLSFGL